MSDIRVYKLDENGEEILHYDGEIIERGETFVCLRATFGFDQADLGVVQFYRGDIFTEWFYTDRWYHVFRVEDKNDGTLKGWYCDITRPATITAHTVRSDDLALDVFITPQGDVHIMDEDEFQALSLPPSEQEAARSAVEQIKQLAAERAAPFHEITS